MDVQQSYRQEKEQGSLYLVGTPIGNLEDMTFRAVRILKEAALIAAEDTRQTRKLLTHFDIQTRLVSYHEHNKEASGKELVRLMLEGQSVALVSDAGLPAISDPGYELVKAAVEEGIAVIPIPGANAALSALIVSGLPTERFLFAGFLPRDRKSMHEELGRLQSVEATLLFYESPHRISKTIDHMLEVWGNRQAALVRELTKRYEEVARGTLAEAQAFLQQNEPLGEYCLVVAGVSKEERALAEAGWWSEFTPEQHVLHYIGQGLDKKEAIKKTAADRGVPKREIYNLLV